MIKFLHLADIHLGITRYRRFGSADRTLDFFEAWRDCIERYAIAERVSFVLIAGDFFDTRRVEPQAMNHAMFCLTKLKEAGIPVLVVEGNHDQREVANRFSWLRSLSQWGFIKLLEPFYEEGSVEFRPWDEQRKSGSFIDIDSPDGGSVRVFGSTWYGTTVTRQLPALIEEAKQHRSDQRYNLMMLHAEVEGQLNHRSIAGLPIAKLNELKSVADYLALGHTHKNFEIDGWAYNPGSLEACSVDEYAHPRGAYLVEVANGQHQAQLVQGYRQRPFIRFNFKVNGYGTPEELREALFTELRKEVRPHNPDETADLSPVLEVSLSGHLGFKSSLLEVNKVRDEIRKELRPFLCITRDLTVPIEYAVATGLHEHTTRGERERRVIESLIARDTRFRDYAPAFTDLVIETKKMALADEEPAKISALIEQRLATTNQTENLVQATEISA
ncbi:MAG TPA: DNA repair exonuclease [Blastocatellia bacterium]|nr:DNA repair exonuclease [Blastocatellia bacterium]